MITLVVAKSDNQVIGRDNQLIWKLSSDLKRFKQLTSGHPIIMGRKTFESIEKALPNRRNIVITKNKNWNSEGIEVVHSLEEALKKAKSLDSTIFIIGGGTIYEQSISLADAIEVTEVHAVFEGDAYFPEIDNRTWKEVNRENFSKDEKNEFNYSFVRYERISEVKNK
ncbi:MAG: dihydrofolate reductase [Weeksellaceae bacterium]|jgi:dihydrofolate reductase|nr:dihydrofolate reductase [Weeksellaceae bacterium]